MYTGIFLPANWERFGGNVTSRFWGIAEIFEASQAFMAKR